MDFRQGLAEITERGKRLAYSELTDVGEGCRGRGGADFLDMYGEPFQLERRLMGCRDQLNHSLKLLWGVFFELQAMALLFFGEDVGGVADEKFLVHVPDLFLGFFSFAI